MTIVEFTVIYLSSGAPFGVLVFFSSRSNPISIAVANSALAAIFWPLLAISWMHRRLLRHAHRNMPPAAPPNDDLGLTRDPLVSEYLTLTRALLDVKHASGVPSSELFEIAGHSDPKLAAMCAERKRNALLARRQQASSAALVEHFANGLAPDPAVVLAMADHCRRLSDRETALRIEQISNRSGSEDLLLIPEHAAEQVRLAA